MANKKVILLILDGFGLAPAGPENGISCANTPNLDRLMSTCPNTMLQASEEAVGLPPKQMGNSEVGHTNIGAGRVVKQSLLSISEDIASGSFYLNSAYYQAVRWAIRNDRPLHILALMSDGGVHSHIDHVYAMLELCRRKGLKDVYIHALMDGRDTPPRSGLGYMKALLKKCEELGVGKVASVQGRFYGMDRDKRWDRVEKGYAAMVCGEGEYDPDPVRVIEQSYANDITDEFILPTVCDKNGMISAKNSVVFMNFRPDRARELSYALTDPDFTGFERRTVCENLRFVCTTQYDAALKNVAIAYPPHSLFYTFGEYIAKKGCKQLRIAETEKYAHVTFFFNGGREEPFENEDRCLIPSPREFATYDLIPEMSCAKVTEECTARIRSGQYDAVICNLANCDMVGHTAVKPAIIKAVETVDEAVGRFAAAAGEAGYALVITADHGNADHMYYADGTPDTAHTTNPVPFILVNGEKDIRLRPGRLADIAPTLLELMGLPVPEEMSGTSLIR